MGEFDLDLQSVEEDLDDADPREQSRVILGVLDGTTDDEEWQSLVEAGETLVLDVEGDVNERAAGFAREVDEAGGDLMHFRGFLVVTPPGVGIDASRVG
jgi:SepF-like predicted cell division protein (DUF552 family)